MENLDSIIRCSRAIMEKKNFIDCARVIFDECCVLTGAVSGYVALLNEAGDENEVLFLESGGLPCNVPHDLPMPIRGLREEAYQKHTTVYSNDFMKTGWTRFLPDGHVVLNNVLFAPLNIDSKTVGILGLANKPGGFTEEDADIVTVFGDLAAIALRKSRSAELLQQRNEALERALAEIKKLRELLPMCCICKNIRNDEGYWLKVDEYIQKYTDTKISHSVCPECLHKYYSDIEDG